MTHTTTIEMFFDLSSAGGDFFALDHATKGLLDDPTYVLAGDVATDVTSYSTGFSVSRGRSRQLDQIRVGRATINLNNFGGEFLPDTISAASPFGGANIRPGKRVRITVDGAVIFDGTIDDWDYSFTVDQQYLASVTAADALATLGTKELTAHTASSQLPGARITAVLDRAEIDHGPNRSIGDGISTLQGDTVTAGTNCLTYCNLVARSDLGRFFASRINALTFLDRHSLVGLSNLVTFSDNGANINFHGLDVVFGSELLANRVTAQRVGGTAQTANNTASQTEFGAVDLSGNVSGLLLNTDPDVADLAEFLAGLHGTPQVRVSGLIVKTHALSAADRANVLALDLGDAITVVWSPPNSSETSNDYVIEGVTHAGDAGQTHTTRFALSPISQGEALILDGAVLGILDSGILAY